MRIVKILLCITLLISSVPFIASCKQKKQDPADEIIKYNITYEPDTLDPQIANDSASRLIILNIFEGLTRIDSDEKAGAGVAEFWNISDNEKTYTFYLRENARWSNGDPVTAEDFRYGLTRTIMPSTGSPTASELFCIKNAEKVNKGELKISDLGITVIDEHTIKIELEYPQSDFLELLATAPAMPCNKKFFESTRGQYGREDDKLISNGAFYVRESGWEHDKYIYLRKNPKYAGKDKPVPAGVNISISESPRSVCDAILSGDIDCYALPASELKRAKENEFNLTSFGDTVWGISFNSQNEVLSHKEIRYAMFTALDRDYILKELPEGCISTKYIISDAAKLNNSSYRSKADENIFIPYSKTASSDLQNAMKKLKIDSLPKLTILCTDDEATGSIVNNIIETWNKTTGGYINKRPVSEAELKDSVYSGEYRVVIAPLIASGDSPINTLSLFTSDSKYNPACLNDPVYDSMITDLAKLPERNSPEKNVEAEKYLNDNGVFYPLFIESRYYACSPDLTGVIFHPYGAEVDFFYAAKVYEN